MVSTTVLLNTRLIDVIADQAHERVSIMIEGERITAIAQGDGPSAPDVNAIDCAGKTIMPGLIDTHVHSTLVSDIDLSLFLATGVTTAHDVDGQIDKEPPCASV